VLNGGSLASGPFDRLLALVKPATPEELVVQEELRLDAEPRHCSAIRSGSNPHREETRTAARWDWSGGFGGNL
jgi:hypothetical protein